MFQELIQQNSKRRTTSRSKGDLKIQQYETLGERGDGVYSQWCKEAIISTALSGTVAM